MRVLQTPVRFYPFIGGVENYVCSLSRELVRLGHEVTVVCADEPRSDAGEEYPGIEVRKLSYIGKIANTNITPGLPRVLLQEDYDIIHSHMPTPWSADWSATASYLKGKPFVLTYHNDIIGQGFASILARLYNNSGLKRVLERADRIIVTQDAYRFKSPHLKKYGEKIAVVPVGVDIDRFRPAATHEARNTIFFLSVLDRFHMYKGLDNLLRAVKRVKEEIPEVRLVIGGQGELEGHYRQMAASLGLVENVLFLGFIPDNLLAERYRESDLFVLPSTSSDQEGFGMVLLEAMACGVPVITTEIAGVAREVADRGAGIVLKDTSEESLASAIIDILQDRSRAARMGRECRKIIEEGYGWERVAEIVEGIFEESIEEHMP